MIDQVPTFFSEDPTPLDRIDPRAKILGIVAVVLFLFLAPDWRWLAGLFAFGVVFAPAIGFRFKWLALLWLVQTFNVIGLMVVPAATGLAEGDLALSDLEDGLRMSFAWLGAVSVLTPLIWTMSIDEITDGLRGLKVPGTVTFAVGYAFRLLNVTLHGLLRTIEALKLKGVDLETRNPLRLLAALPKLMVPVVFTIVRRSSAMMAVLRMRRASLGDPPTLRLHHFGALDTTFVLTAFTIVALTASVRYSLLGLGA